MKKYYEIVFEGHYNKIKGFLEGYKLGNDKSWDFFLSDDYNIKTDTFSEILLEWISLKSKIHHIVIEEEFYRSIEKDLPNESDFSSLKKDHLRSIKEIKASAFKFETTTYGKKYGLEIQETLKQLPEEVELNNYKPNESDYTDKGEHKDLDLYAPEHNYSFKATGEISGNIDKVLDFHKKLNDHPLINVEEIELKF